MNERHVTKLRPRDKIRLDDGGYCEVINTDPALRDGHVLIRYRIMTGKYRGGAFEELVRSDQKVIPT